MTTAFSTLSFLGDVLTDNAFEERVEESPEAGRLSLDHAHGHREGAVLPPEQPDRPAVQHARGRRALERELGDPVPEQLLDARGLALQQPLHEGAAQLGYYDWDWSYRHKDGNALHLPLHVRRHKPAFWDDLHTSFLGRPRSAQVAKDEVQRRLCSYVGLAGGCDWHKRDCKGDVFSGLDSDSGTCAKEELHAVRAGTFRLLAGRGFGFEKLLQS